MFIEKKQVKLNLAKQNFLKIKNEKENVDLLILLSKLNINNTSKELFDNK